MWLDSSYILDVEWDGMGCLFVPGCEILPQLNISLWPVADPTPALYQIGTPYLRYITLLVGR